MSECLFCRIAGGDVPATLLADEGGVIALKDIKPQAPTHVLIMPKAHIEKVSDLSDENASIVSQSVLVANQLAKKLGLSESGYRLVINCGAQAGQSVMHLHMHLLGGRPMRWPPG